MRKQGWTYKKLGEVCDTINGLWKGKKPPFVRVGVIRNANFTKEFTLRFDNVEFLDVEERQFTKRKLQKGDLIVEKSGGSTKQPVGRAVLFEKEDGDFSFSNFTSVLRIKDKKELLYQFLYKYLLFSYKRGDTLTMQKATTGIHNIEFDKFLGIDIPVPPMEEQGRIVARLDAAFAQIDELRANAEKQLEEARALFNAALNEEMKPKKGWEDCTLGDVCDLMAGGDVPKNRFSKKKNELYKVPIYSNGVINEGLYGYTDIPKITKNCITISGRGTIGFVVKRTEPFFPVIRLIVAIPKDGVDVSYLRYCVISKRFERNGAAIPQLTVPMIKNVVIPIPTLNEQRAIVERLDGLSERVKELEEIARTTVKECDALKQSILRETFE